MHTSTTLNLDSAQSYLDNAGTIATPDGEVLAAMRGLQHLLKSHNKTLSDLPVILSGSAYVAKIRQLEDKVESLLSQLRRYEAPASTPAVKSTKARCEWTPEKIRRLQELDAENLHYVDIAETMSHEFGITLGSDAVRSKIARVKEDPSSADPESKQTGQPWTPDEEARLIALYKGNHNYLSIASLLKKEFGRGTTSAAVRMKLIKLRKNNPKLFA